jgi:hypothetical protein
VPAAYLHQGREVRFFAQAASSEGTSDGRLQDAELVDALTEMRREADVKRN